MCTLIGCGYQCRLSTLKGGRLACPNLRSYPPSLHLKKKRKKNAWSQVRLVLASTFPTASTVLRNGIDRFKWHRLFTKGKISPPPVFPLESNPRFLSLTFVSFRFDSLFTLLKKVSRKPIRNVTIRFQDQSSAASLRLKNRFEITVLWLNESPIRYVFGAGTRAIRYSVLNSDKL